jgi:hypothetical protein
MTRAEASRPADHRLIDARPKWRSAASRLPLTLVGNWIQKTLPRRRGYHAEVDVFGYAQHGVAPNQNCESRGENSRIFC